jgi:abortive infection bacteriophage resistance protein
MKQATNIADQIKRLRDRNVIISDEEKAKENLLDIGYYRLGFYFFPFELTYPELRHRDHMMKAGTKFTDAVALYYFDFDVRNILMKYISRIEVALRTYMIYTLSNKYRHDPCWFVNNSVVGQDFIDNFDKSCYDDIKKNPTIRRHHKHYKSDKYAPAWKTLEYMTLGSILTLYADLILIDDKRLISQKFGINQTVVFENYMEAIRCIRNICAHGAVLYDARMYQLIQSGPAGKVTLDESHRLGAAIKVLAYLLGKISTNRQHELLIQLNAAYMTAVNKSNSLQNVIEGATQMRWDLASISNLQAK